MRRLAEAGLTTREACGNSVRNITACPYAGVAADEPFDVTPYAEALTRYLLRHPLSASLPRKFKIAFEGCAHDHIGDPINDIGWLARVRTVDGAPARLPRHRRRRHRDDDPRRATCSFDFLPVGEMFNVAEAVIRVFHRLGDYKHKQRNRLKFLVKSLGWDGVPGRVRARARGVPRRRRRAAAVRSRAAAGRAGRRPRRRDARRRSPRSSRARCIERQGDRPRHRSAGRAAPNRRRRTSSRTGRAPTCGRRSRQATRW